jgi:beta-galactosidase GanA
MSRDTLPRLRKGGRVTQLIVGGKPFLMLGGELGNSSASDATELGAMFEKLRRMYLNTVLLPVYWDLIEPQEGQFDFSLVQAAVETARAQELRLVLLWFGTWKNSMSCYAPGWVKRDTERFTRVRLRSGAAVEIISPTSGAAREADARAFSALMRWLRDFDGDHHTVVMVQVENEIGMIPEPRDYSAESEAAYQGAVPEALLSRLTAGELGPEVDALWRKAGSRTEGNWADVFGTDAEGQEVFSAWQFSTFTEVVTAAGKREYPLPMFVNAALIRPGYRPGQYPGAGPLPHLMEVWQTGAPSLDMLCPDIYFPNFIEWVGRYVRGENPLFIPEMAASARVGGNALYAIGQLGAMGVAPFAIETTDKAPLIAECYRLLDGMSALILECQREGRAICLSPRVGFDWSVSEGPERGDLGGFVFEATFDRAADGADDRTTTLPTLGVGRWEAPVGTPCGATMILQIGSEEFVVVGLGVVVTFALADGQGKVGIESVQEGRYEAGGFWHGGRWLNGDQTHQGRHIRLPGDTWHVQRVRLYRYV